MNDPSISPPNTIRIELADDFDQTGRFTADGIGTVIAPQPVEFVENLAKAFREGDSEFLVEHLHPDVLALYAGACVEFADGISSPDLDIFVHSIVDVADWTLTLDDHELIIPNAVNLGVTRTKGGQVERTTMHVAARPGNDPPAEMTWFADCGDPFPIG